MLQEETIKQIVNWKPAEDGSDSIDPITMLKEYTAKLQKLQELEAELAWDRNSEYIGDDLFSLEAIAGNVVMVSRIKYIKAISESINLE